MKSYKCLDVNLLYSAIFILGCLTFFTDAILRGYNIDSKNLVGVSTIETNLEIDMINTDEKDDDISISSNKNNTYSHYSYITRIESANNFINLTALVKSKNIKHGSEFWETTRISLHFLDTNNKLILESNNTAKHIYKNTLWSTINHTFKIPATASYAKTSLEFLNSTGTLSIKDIKIAYAQESKTYKTAKYTLLLLWFFIILSVAITLSSLIENKYLKIMFLLITSFIVIGVTLPQDIKSAILNTISFNIITIDSDNSRYILQTILSNPMKTAHFFAFTCITYITFITFIATRKKRNILINLIIFSLVSEIIQLLIVERTPQLNDIIIDCAGIILGLLLYVMQARFTMR